MNNVKILKLNVLATVITGVSLLLPAAATAEPTVPNLAAHTAQQYRQLARFPADNQPLDIDAPDPILAARTPTRQTLPGPYGAEPALSVWASGVSFQQGDSVSLYAALDVADYGTDLDLLTLPPETAGGPWLITGSLESLQAGQLAELEYRDDGEGADFLAGDGVYTATYSLTSVEAPKLGQAENIAVKVTAKNEAGDERKAIGGFLYSNPAAELTGRFRDRLEDGSMIVSAQVEVFAKGRFHLSATLDDILGRSLGSAQAAEILDPGIHWIDLPYYGLIFHKRGLPGPYRLSSVTLATTNGMPNALGPVLTDVHLTRFYPLALMTRAPFNQPDLIDAARRLEAEAALPDGGSSRSLLR